MATMSLSKYIHSIPRSYRGRIRKAAFRHGFRMGHVGNDDKVALAEAIFEVEDEREHSHGPYDPAVVAMRAVRNQLYDDLGRNETSAGAHRLPAGAEGAAA